MRSFLVRAITRGTNRVRLDAVRIGRRWITSVEAIERWLARQTEVAIRPGHRSEPPSTDRLKGARRRAAEATDRELRRLGV
jgi:hypothetical protein